MEPAITLDAHEARLFGVLIEKALTTPDQYPLSLNAAVNAANQKSNRDPLLSLSEEEVAAALDGLEKKYLVRRVFSRVERYRHNGRDALNLDTAQLAILAELLMRGPQQPGELRARVSRMHAIESLDLLEQALAPLLERGFVQRLDPSPGSRAERYIQLLSPNLHPLDAPAHASAASAPDSDLAGRVAALEGAVESLRRQLIRLAEQLGETLDGEPQ
ncbi:MAG TPA: DUF480 domain-containing protein [Candidatus Binatia bacterium]|nr:DUF480 domain-containing protein [Candidatus Binatia bacterium]